MKKNRVLFIALIIFLVLMLPFIGSIPYLDGNIDLVKTHNFIVGGFDSYLGNWFSVHPPMKVIMASIFITIGGLNQISYNLVGILFGLFGIIVFYKLCSRLTNQGVTNIAVLLFCTSPLFLSAGLFSLIDHLLEILILASFYYYLKHKSVLYFLFASLSILTKETGAVIVVAIFITEGLWIIINIINKNLNYKKSLKNLIISLSPLITAAVWIWFLKTNGKTLWSDWNYSETGGEGTISTILNNVFSLKMFNKYAYQNWLQLFFLNFNWALWMFAVFGIIKGRINLIKNKTVLSMFLFCLIYIISVC